MLRKVYEWGTRLGYEMELPTQDGDELPDAVGEIPPTIVPDGDLSEGEREQIIRSRLEEEYPDVLELSGTDTLYIEAESKGLSKPGGPIKNAAKAPSPEQLLFVVGDGGDDGLTRNAKRLASIFGVGDGGDPFVSTRTPVDAARKFYTRGQLEMARDDTGVEKLALVEGDVSTEWVELKGGSIICRDRDSGETYLQFDGAKDYRERQPSDAPATVHYDLEDSNYVVERGGKVERKYGAKGPLTDDWTQIYEPVVPEAMFREHGHESVPEPDAFRIAIVPNDDRDLEGDPELLMFHYATESPVPIGAWLDGSTDSVTVDASAESELEPPTKPESDLEPAPEPPEPKPDPEFVPEEAATSEGNDTECDDNDSTNPFSGV